MSCHLVSKPAIDLLVDLFFNGPSDIGPEEWGECEGTRDELGKALAMENLRGYTWFHSYNTVAEKNPDWDYQDPRVAEEVRKLVDAEDYSCVKVPLDKEEIEWRQKYKHTPRAKQLTTVEGLSLLHSWQYDSCDHLNLGDTDSDVYSDTKMLESELISCLPGYYDLGEVNEDNTPALPARIG